MTQPCFGRLAALLAGAATLTACAVVPDVGPQRSIRPAAELSVESFGTSGAAWPVVDWWTGYGDQQLTGLINEALASSPDIAAAAARLRVAQAYAQQAGAARLPSIDISGNAGVVRQSANNGIPAAVMPDGWQQTAKVGLGLSFDLDLWGRNRAALAAAMSDAQAASFELAEARLALSTGIAATYADLAQLHAQRDTLEAALVIRQESLDLVAKRVATGLDTRADLKQAQSRVPAARAELAANDEAIALTRNALAALIGAGPDRGLTIGRPSVASLRARGVPAGASIDLIGRRPDIAAARSAAEAAASRINVARAAFYPNINLSALIGLQAIGFDRLFNSGSTFGNAGPAISLPLFHGGALKAQYRSARGSYDEAIARYDASIIQALREVADAATSQKQLAVQLAESRQALGDAEEGNRLTRQRYEGGLSTYLNVLSAEEGVLEARRTVAELQSRAFALDVAMVRALGGGFATL